MTVMTFHLDRKGGNFEHVEVDKTWLTRFEQKVMGDSDWPASFVKKETAGYVITVEGLNYNHDAAKEVAMLYGFRSQGYNPDVWHLEYKDTFLENTK